MAATTKRRSNPQRPNPNSSPFSSLISLEPPPSLFPSKHEFLKLLAVVIIASLVAFSCNFVLNILNRQPKPFCDSTDEFDDYLSDNCDPCPRNGVCHEGKLECASGYRKLGSLCVEDGDIDEIAKKLSGLVETHVCEGYVQYLCRGTGKIWAREDDLWNKIDELKLMEDYGNETVIYMLAKQKAVQTVDKQLETRVSSSGVRELKCPELVVRHYQPVSCRIRQWIAEHALVLLLISAVLAGFSSVLLKLQRRRYLLVRAEELYNEVCDILEETALKSKSVNGETEPWIVVSWLRDHLLSPKERRNPLLWNKVEELVQEDSRLDRYPKMVKGETKVVWEWQVEGPLSSSGKKKKGEGSRFKQTDGTKLASNTTQWTRKAIHL